MKLKCRKIKGVDKSICTAEQKIAYNYAFAKHLNGADEYKLLKSRLDKNIFLNKIRDNIIKEISEHEDMKKYNIDAIFAALNSGLEPYFEKFFIASSYEQIGKTFAIPYEII